MALPDAEIDHALSLAIRAAHTAAAIITRSMEMRTTEGAVEVRTKSNSTDLVTQYDKQCEDEVLHILRSGTPTYAILSEETHSDAALGDGPTWVVDPIDGTTSFVHGLYDCCVSIALVFGGQPILGVINAPFLQEVFTAVRGRGAFCNGQRIHVSAPASLHESVVLIHQPYNRSEAAVNSTIAIQKEFAMHPVHSVRCNGSAALDMCYVASGRAEIYFECGIYAWDIAAGTIIVREAGGVVHDVESTDTFDLMRRSVCCGCSTAITSHAVDLLIKYDYRNALLNTA